MTASQMIGFVDRIGLSVMNAMVFIGLPLVAAGLLVR